MKHSFEAIAAIRFGYGFRPGGELPATITQMLSALSGEDAVQIRYPARDFAARRAIFTQYRNAVRRAKKNKSRAAKATQKLARRKRFEVVAEDFSLHVGRAVLGGDGFRERLASFWADHFSIAAKGQLAQLLWGSYQDTAIRPHITGRFSDLLVSAVTHPSMLIYLDQNKSFGPNSRAGQRRHRGLNENLAREVLELHTMGVGGGYSQNDVRQFAELLTGLTVTDHGTAFKPTMAEPGAEIVLGHEYGGPGKARLADIRAFLDDVAVHPDTAHHIARKLAVHFVSDDPDEDLVRQLARIYRESSGDLMQVYQALLEHPAAWVNLGQKVKRPFEFIVSGLRAFGVGERALLGMKPGQTRRLLAVPMATMGQNLRSPPGPDGWPEDSEAWITPQGLAARLQWALVASARLGGGMDPRDFVQSTLHGVAGDTLRRAVGGSANKTEALALVLSSPEFNRR